MAEVYDHPLSNISNSSHHHVTSKRASFTVWMKSLVMQGNGCTVFNQNGDIVYRIDNYDNKGSDEVYLMDVRGNVLFTILRRIKVFGRWTVYKGDNTKKPTFQVTKKGEITLLSNNVDEATAAACYKIKAMAADKSSLLFKIVDYRGGGGVGLAEATRKQTSSGELLGDDVLALVVEPYVDHSFIMALVTVYGLMNRRL